MSTRVAAAIVCLSAVCALPLQPPHARSIRGVQIATFTTLPVPSNPHPTSESIITLGQSGFIQNVSGTPVLDPHFRDQFELYKNFQYKPMHLYINTQLKE